MARPVMHAVYTAAELHKLDLLDSPCLRFSYRNGLAVIQNCHLTEEELLSVPSFADTRWRYIRTTHEWIPVFHAVDDDAVIACMDIERDRSPYSDDGSWWVTPKGFPREQYVATT